MSLSISNLTNGFMSGVMTILTSLPGDGVFVNIQPDKLLHVFGYDNPYLSAR